MKRILSVILLLVLVAACACALGEAQYTVGICQYIQHEALDQAAQGFMDSLDAELGRGTVEYNLQNASGDSGICAAIVTEFVASEVDLILANSTASLHAANAATGDIPILGTSITEYGVVLGIDAYEGPLGINVSGTSDLAPLDAQADMILELFPDTRTVALLYCSAEPNSQYQVDTVQAELESKGIKALPYPFSDSNDLAVVCQAACEAADVIYTPTDNTVAANAGIVDNICQPAGKPVVTGDTGTCSIAGVAVLGISYYDLGATTGKMAAKVLTGETDITSLPISYAENVAYYYNPAICEALGVNVPSHYIPLPEQ